uniref:Nuclear transcription factor Y subunit beta n=1 Tax=Caligus clemensi TaxID=344056 RepID=C1C1T9_CALCM|nr:Nuclear transcription factor Y subunit beta [Caligus clemensi]
MDVDRGDSDLSGGFHLEGSGGEYVGVVESRLDEDVEDGNALREQDRFLPIANVARLMKKVIPSQGKIAKDARECVQECVSEFISFITSEASDRCQAEKRKTINGEGILFAMSTLGFDNYVDPLKMYLQKYREAVKGDKTHPETFEDVPDDVLANALPSITTDQQGTPVLLYSGNSFHLN